jgi:Non-repetitive/WGA-negative nucleoporin C-terminal
LYVSLLTEFPREKASLKKFLQPQKYEKLRWINELSLRRYQDAGHTLQELATHERRLRQKKLALSISKLSLLGTLHPTAPTTGTTDAVDIALAAVTAQSQFTDEILKPVVEQVADSQARVELALEHLYLARNLKKSHLRTRVVKRGLETVVEDKVVDAETLIDLFTLKKRGTGPSPETEFETYFWALQVLRAAEVPLLRGAQTNTRYRR